MTDFRALVKALSEGRVDFIIIGGLAAAVHGSARLTQDVDCLYSRQPANLERLVAALGAHAPYLRGAPPGLPFEWNVATIARGLNFTLTTGLGDLDLLGEIPGGGDYDALRPEAVEVDLFGYRCLCLDLAPLIRVKRAAGRPKDFEALAELEALLDERRRSSS